MVINAPWGPWCFPLVSDPRNTTGRPAGDWRSLGAAGPHMRAPLQGLVPLDDSVAEKDHPSLILCANSAFPSAISVACHMEAGMTTKAVLNYNKGTYMEYVQNGGIYVDWLFSAPYFLDLHARFQEEHAKKVRRRENRGVHGRCRCILHIPYAVMRDAGQRTGGMLACCMLVGVA